MTTGRRWERTRWIAAALLVIVVWAGNVSAQLQAGSLEFAYTTPPDPIGVVAFNYTSDGKPPFIAYEIAAAQGGRFTAPWLLLTDEDGVIIGDTVILLTNPHSVAALSIEVKLRGADGVLEPGCTKQLTVGPKATLKRSTRVLFPSCPLIP